MNTISSLISTTSNGLSHLEDMAGLDASFNPSRVTSGSTFFQDMDRFLVKRNTFDEQNERLMQLLCEEDPFQSGRDIPADEYVWEGFQHPIAKMHAAEGERLRRLDDPHGAEECFWNAENADGAADAGWFDA